MSKITILNFNYDSILAYAVCENKQKLGQCFYCEYYWPLWKCDEKIDTLVAVKRLDLDITASKNDIYEAYKNKQISIINSYGPNWKPFPGYALDPKYKNLVKLMETKHYFDLMFKVIESQN